MTETKFQKPKEFIKDLAKFDKTQKSLHMPATAKNIDWLKELQIDNLWRIGAIRPTKHR